MKHRHSLVAIVALVAFAGPVRALDYITLDFQGAMSDIERQTFTDAAAYWNSVITGFKAPYFYEEDGVTIDPVQPTLTISASIAPIDTVGGTLGQAGWETARYADNDNVTPNPTYARWYAATGSMLFDSYDVAGMIANGTFYGVVLHEMAHILGIGTLWEFNTIPDYGAIGNPMYDPAAEPLTGPLGEPVGAYVGQYALAKYISEFDKPGATYVPVEKGGGPGTADGHWNEFDNGLGISDGTTSNLTGLDISQELMTGWASDVFFVSQMTIGSLEDLGYEVDYSKAGIVDHVVAVPEPAAWAFAGSAVALIAVKRRRNVRRSRQFL